MQESDKSLQEAFIRILDKMPNFGFLWDKFFSNLESAIRKHPGSYGQDEWWDDLYEELAEAEIEDAGSEEETTELIHLAIVALRKAQANLQEKEARDAGK